MGVSGVPWLYTDTRLCSTVALLTLPDDRVKSSVSKGLDKERKTRLSQKGTRGTSRRHGDANQPQSW